MANKNHECENCGYTFSGNERKCKYCGTPNPNYTQSGTNWRKVLSDVTGGGSTSTPTNASDNGINKVVTKSGFNIVIFIVLLICFWPAALVYAIIKALK
ncbi:MAG: hypothetical protein J6328_05905 [Bacilli bacterium]|nr:hypothetical protein [Bacilli bacterium]